jgi:hypothetical protein
MAPIELTDSQMDMVFHACEPLPPDARDAFVRDLANALAGSPSVGDGLLWREIRAAQKRHWKPPKEKPPDQWRRRVGPTIP